MGKEPAKSDVLIGKVAAKQHGVISSVQLKAIGVTDVAASRRANAGRLHRIHRGVYAVGHTRLSFEGRWMAAVLACGAGAVVSHSSAAALWGLLSPARGPIDITLPSASGRSRRAGITTHRSRTLSAPVITCRDGIPVTKPARTLRDLRRTAPQPVHQRALRRALDLRLITNEDLEDIDLTRSQLERLFLRVCRRHRLPSPEVNVRVGPYEVDFLWRDQSVIVETDGFRYHRDRVAFEWDRARDARLQALGYRVLRFTYRQVRNQPRMIAGSLRALLRPGGRGRGRS